MSEPNPTSGRQKPSMGRIVIFKTRDYDDAVVSFPAMITNVIEGERVNLEVFGDHGRMQKRYELDVAYGEELGASSHGGGLWHWPARV